MNRSAPVWSSGPPNCPAMSKLSLDYQAKMKELVLSFHGLGEPPQGVGSEEIPYWISTSSFARLLDCAPDFQEAGPRITITFDDGNSSDALLAFPELFKRGLVGNFLVCAGRIGQKRYLDRAMIKELLDGGMLIGSHGMDHRDWRTLDSSALDVEITDARRKLEDIIQRTVTSVAIPFGSYDRRVLHRLMRDPWECIYTSDRGIARSSAQIKPRETIDITMQDEQILRKLSANAHLHIRIQRWLSRHYKQLR
jgi:peptidoglycan/xylan/chitin deacetylase (PgdA/CDA1 family)